MNTEEELWETAEGIGQRHVYSGNDPGTKWKERALHLSFMYNIKDRMFVVFSFF